MGIVTFSLLFSCSNPYSSLRHVILEKGKNYGPNWKGDKVGYLQDLTRRYRHSGRMGDALAGEAGWSRPVQSL